MRLDDTLDDKIVYAPIVAQVWIERIATMGSQLVTHESFISHLGVGDVILHRLPSSINVRILWNDSEESDVELYIANISSQSERRRYIESALYKYLAPTLED